MTHDDGAAARRYHEATKHSPTSVQRGPHGLDWDNQPVPFKIYSDLPAEGLPRRLDSSGVGAFDAIQGQGADPGRSDPPDRAALGRLLHFSLGVLRHRHLGGGRVVHFRAAPCTGALYHVDAYVVCGELPDLAAGIYHFGPHDFSVRRLRAGDLRGVLSVAAGGEARVAEAPATLVLASTYWRNSWKYRQRAYRHVFWDGGTVLAQLLAQAAADGWPARVVLGFGDRDVEDLIGLDRAREGAIALVPIGRGAPVPRSPQEIEAIRYRTAPLSTHEIDYPEIREMHAASSLASGGAARAWRESTPRLESSPARGQHCRLVADPAEASDPLEEVVRRRGSTRSFARLPIGQAALLRLLTAASAPLEADYRPDPARSLVELYVITHAVEGVEAGSYRWHAAETALERLSLGEFRREAGFLALGQSLGADPAVNVYAVADLDSVLGALGSRGYRAAQLEGGIAGGRTYLAAYAQGIGASGLTFFDDDVIRFFGLPADRFGVMFLTSAGIAARG